MVNSCIKLMYNFGSCNHMDVKFPQKYPKSLLKKIKAHYSAHIKMDKQLIVSF